MESLSEPTLTKYEQITGDVPEAGLAEFHAFFTRFLVGPGRQVGRGEHRRHRHGRRQGSAQRHERVERSETYEGPVETSGQAPETTKV
ncbi:MAG: hypothetical protein ACTHQQ_08960 [Solirubrobacteraceae bacterium]